MAQSEKQGFAQESAKDQEKSKQEQSLSTLQQLLQNPNIPEGASLKAGDVGVGIDPSMRMLQGQMKGQASAVQNSTSQYNRQAPRLMDAYQKLQEGMKAVNDPNQTSSVGAAKTMLIAGVGQMNRYNQQEGAELVPNTFLQAAQSFANKLGDDKNPLSDAQRRSINSLFADGMKQLQSKHESIRQNALQAYQVNPYYEQGRGQQLQQSLGAPFSAQLNQGIQDAGKYPQTPVSAPDQQQPPPGIISQITSGLGNLLKPAAPGVSKKQQALASLKRPKPLEQMTPQELNDYESSLNGK